VIRKSLYLLAVSLVTAPLAACPTGSSTPADAGAGSDQAAQVCAHLAAVGCPQPVTCPVIFRKDQGKLTDFKPGCLLAASNVAAVTACGTVQCGAP